MALDDKLFYQALGQRISQQTMAHYEGGRLRIAVALLPALTKTLEITVEEAPKAAKGKHVPASTLEKQIEQISQLPRAKQKFVMETLDTVIQQAS